MRHRRRSNGARLLAVAALAGATIGVVLVVKNTTGDSSSGSGSASTATTTSSVPGRFQQRRYKVRRGDTLGLISQRSDIDIETLQKLNPGLDANSLNAGQVITLRKPKPG